MSKGTIFGGLGLITIIGIAAGGYYWSLLHGALPTPDLSQAQASSAVEPGSCSAKEVVSTLIELVRSRGAHTRVLIEATSQKLAALENGRMQAKNAQYVAAIKQCTDSAAADGRAALNALGFINQPYESNAVSVCTTLPTRMQSECYKALNTVASKQQGCSAAAQGNAYGSSGLLADEEERDKIVPRASYDLMYIRTIATDQTVGARQCAARLSVKLPRDWGNAQEDIAYKVEKTSDGQFYITLLNPDQL